jgi:hypothetical protein
MKIQRIEKYQFSQIEQSKPILRRFWILCVDLPAVHYHKG